MNRGFESKSIEFVKLELVASFTAECIDTQDPGADHYLTNKYGSDWSDYDGNLYQYEPATTQSQRDDLLILDQQLQEGWNSANRPLIGRNREHHETWTTARLDYELFCLDRTRCGGLEFKSNSFYDTKCGTFGVCETGLEGTTRDGQVRFNAPLLYHTDISFWSLGSL